MNYGYVYFRTNKWYIQESVIKMGVTECCYNRNSTYKTGEVELGEYICIIKVPLEKLKIIDLCLKRYFKKYNIYKGGGTEFYSNIIEDVKDYLLNNGIIKYYDILSSEEIVNLNRKNRIADLLKFKNIFKKAIQRYKERKRIKSELIQPNEHQLEVLKDIEKFYEKNNIGKLIWACGLGKALLSILIVRELNYKTILIGVPGKRLQEQMRKEIIKVFPDNIIFVGGNSSVNIKSFLESTIEPKFVITTYHSCNKLLNFTFDFKIGDEAHHLVGISNVSKKDFCKFHEIKSTKTLFMTATAKVSEPNTYTMDDESTFGKLIDSKSVKWSIENKKITDYSIVVLKNTEIEIDEIMLKLNITNNKQLFISCYMCLKSFSLYPDLTHILLYANKTEDANKASEYIKILSQHLIIDISYNKSLHSKNCKYVDNEISMFEKSSRGIISGVYLFGEGFNLPKLNGVCIAGNMQSETRIVQYLLRPNRLEYGNPDKRAYIIIPYIDFDINVENGSSDNIKHIIYHMRNVDENVEQKICISSLKPNINIKCNDEPVKINQIKDLNELTEIQLKLRYSKSLNSKFTEEQNEYNYIRSINISLNLKSKKEYINSKHKNYIESPEEYFKLRGVWDGWYDFIGINTKDFIKTKEEWIKFCKEKNITSLSEYNKQSEQYNCLPREPAEFYNNFGNILHELKIDIARRR